METEEEQVERLKAWLKENGMSIVFGIVIGIGGIGGYNYWIDYQEKTAVQASETYIKMMDALNVGNAESVLTHADSLIAEHGSSDYALMAHLALAKSHVSNAEFDKAELALQQVVGSAEQKPLAYIARTRLAAVQLQNGKIDSALATLNVDFPAEFAARVDELKGDIHAQQGNTAEAISAYRKAQQADPQPANIEFLQQKLDDLGARS